MLNTSPPSSSVSPTAAVSSGCCTTGRPVLADPVTGQTVCSCQLESAAAAGRVLSSYPRLAAAAAAAGVAGGGVAGAMASYPLPTEAAGYAGLTDQAVATAALYANLGGAYEMKDAPGALAGLGAPPPYFHPYDPSSAAMYPYANGYCGLDFNSAAHRKNATREATNTLKAWLNEHKKNPYPTKGEKIMLAIITKMTLTQVSTWFANARRRLKKENKMTWEPRNRTDDDDDGDDVEKANESNNEDIDISTQISDRDSSAGSISPGVSENELDTASKLLQHRASLFPGHVPVPPDSIPLGFSAASAAATGIDRSLKLIPSLPPAPASASALVPPESATKPRIWSLADTAMSRSTSLTPISVAALSPQLGGPPIPIPAAAAASPSLYPYSSAFSPLKPWLGVPYPVVSLASPLGLAAVVSRAHMTPYDVTSSALSSRLAAAAAAALTPNITSTIAPDPQTPGKPCQPRPRNSPSFSDSDGDNPKARAHSNSSARAVSSQSPPTSKFSVTELCRKDDQSIKTKLKIDQ